MNEQKINKSFKKIRNLINFASTGVLITDNDIKRVLNDLYELGLADGYANRLYEEIERQRDDFD